MSSGEKTIAYKVKSLQEINSILKTIGDIKPVGGATGFSVNGTKIKLPKHILVLSSLPELKQINKTERHYDFGACASFNSILELGRKNIPHVLYDSLKTAANSSIRYLATLGGNLAQLNPKTTAYLPLIALDSKLEIKTAGETDWLPITKYLDPKYGQLRAKPYVITRIRIPRETWSKSIYSRIGGTGIISKDTASFIFLMRIQKNILTSMRLLFAAGSLIKEKEFDNLLLGKALPLYKKDIPGILEKAHSIFTPDKFDSAFHASCFFNLLEDSLYKLT